MYNRKERRKIEKELKIHKILKVASIDLKEEILKRRLEQSAACQAQFEEKQKTYDREFSEELYAKRLRFYTESMGNTIEEAEKILERERLTDEERSLRKKRLKNESISNIHKTRKT